MDDRLERRHFSWEGCLNARDLGGFSANDGRCTRHGVFFRGDTTCELTERGRAELLADGVRTIVDLRNDAELGGAPNPFATVDGVTYLHRSFNEAGLEERLQRIASPPERYVTMIDANGTRIVAIFEALATAPPAILFHCHGGRDRTGIVAALLLGFAGVPAHEILDDFVLSDVRLGPRYRKWRETFTPVEVERADRALGEARDSIAAALRRVEEGWGGSARYLLAHGMAEGRLEQLRTAFVQTCAPPERGSVDVVSAP